MREAAPCRGDCEAGSVAGARVFMGGYKAGPKWRSPEAAYYKAGPKAARRKRRTTYYYFCLLALISARRFAKYS
jgi:hypothetical protein